MSAPYNSRLIPHGGVVNSTQVGKYRAVFQFKPQTEELKLSWTAEEFRIYESQLTYYLAEINQFVVMWKPPKHFLY